jgi:AbrB family looped-hinge helix DNA binding protein
MDIRMVTITDKGQVSIPVSVQRAARLKRGDRLAVFVENDAVVFRKASTLTKAQTVAPVKVRPVKEFMHVLKGMNIQWDKAKDGWHDKY